MSSSLRVVEPVAGYPVHEIDHPLCRARVARHGAQVMEWQPAHAARPVLYLSPQTVLREGKAIRGGIPICWPWFNAHPNDPAQPSHGFARTAFWEAGEASEDGEGVTLRFTFRRGPWVAEVAIRAGAALEVELETRNLGDAPLPLSGALHSYLAVGDAGRVRVGGLDDCDYLDTVGTPTPRRQQGEVSFDREVDRIYDHAGSCRLDDPLFGRVIRVSKGGSPSTVVWNPWREKAAALGDLPDEGFRDFVCLEAAIANERAALLAPGGTRRLATRIEVDG